MKEIYTSITNYYGEKIREHGATPRGVDWNGEESQHLRFKILSQVLTKEDFSISDIGCGYGSYLKFLSQNFSNFRYQGYDISYDMVEAARKINGSVSSFKEISNLEKLKMSDFSVASGIFNVKVGYSDAAWIDYVLESLHQIDKKSGDGFSFNMLTKYSDKEKLQKDLYYADPCFFFDYCKKNFSRNVALLHDYGLYEFTILVRKV